MNKGIYKTASSGIKGLNDVLNGLTPGDTVKLMLRAIGAPPCGDTVYSNLAVCHSKACQPVTFTNQSVISACAGSTVPLAVKNISALHYGISWNGGQYGKQFTFNLTVTKDTVINFAVIDSTQLVCGGYFGNFTVHALPQPHVTLTSNFSGSDSICFGNSISFTASPSNLNNYNFFNGALSVQSGTSNVFTTQQLSSVNAITVIGSIGVCADTSSTHSSPIHIAVEQPLAPTQVTCGKTTGNSITFNWDSIPGATGYLVSINGSSFFTPSSGKKGLSHLLTGLNPGVEANLTVKGLSAGPCGNTPIAVPVACYAENCPGIDFAGNFNPPSICKGDSIVLSINTITSKTYQVSWAGGAWSTQTNFVVYPTADTSILVSVNTQNPNGCPPAVKYFNIKVNPKPIMSLVSSIASDSICAGESISFTALPTGLSAYHFYDDFLLVQNNNNNIYTTSQISNGHFIRVVGFSGACADSLHSFPNTLKTTVVNALTNPQVNCANSSKDSLQFEWLPVPGASGYEISIDGANYVAPSTGLTGLSHLITGLNIGDIRTAEVKALGGGSCGNSAPSKPKACAIIVSSNTPCKDIGFVLNQSTKQNTCAGDSVTLSISKITTKAPGISWNGGPMGSDSVFKFKALFDTVITLLVMDNNQPTCPPKVNYFTIKVARPNVTVTSNAVNDTLCGGGPIKIIASPAGYDNYKFYNGNVLLQDSVSPVLSLPNLPLPNAIKIVATLNGCSDTSTTKIISVLPLPSLSLASSLAQDSICAGSPVTFTASPTGLTGYAFYDNFQLVQSGASNTYTTSNLNAGHSVMVLGRIGHCIDSANALSAAVKVNVITPLTAPQVNCGGSTNDSLKFTWNNVPGASGYKVSINGGTLASPSSGSNGLYHWVSGLQNGAIASAEVVAIGNGICSNSVVSSVQTCTVTSSPTIPCKDITYTLRQQTQLQACFGDSVLLGISTISAKSPSIAWNYGVAGTDSSFTFRATKDTSIAVVVLDLNQPTCPAKVNFFTVSVAHPAVAITSNTYGDTVCGSNSLRIVASPAGYDRYKFYNGKILLQDSTSPVFSITNVASTTNLTIVAISKGCSDTSAAGVFKPVTLPSMRIISSQSNDSVCQGTPVSFTATPNGLTSYAFYDNFQLVQLSASNNYTTSGLINGHSIMVVGHIGHCADSASTAAGVKSSTASTTVLPTLTAPQVNCGGSNPDSIEFIWTPSVGALGYQVSINGGPYVVPSSGSHGLSHWLAGLSLGNKDSIRVMALGAGLCGNSAATSSLTCATSAVNCTGITFTTNKTLNANVCSGNPVYLSLSNFNITNPFISWNGGSYGKSIGLQIPNITNDTIINFSVKDGAHPSCPSVNNSFVLKANKSPVVGLKANTYGDILCSGTPLKIVATPTGYAHYTFFNGSTLLQDSSSPVLYVTALPAGSKVTVVSSNLGCTDTSSAKVLFIQNLPTLQLNSSVPTDSICQGAPITFSALPTGLNAYSFYDNGKLVQRSSAPTYTTTGLISGHSIMVTGLLGSCLDSATTAVASKNTTQQTVVIPALVAPQVNCGKTSTDSLEFVWEAVAGATGYQISVNGGAYVTPSSGVLGTAHYVTGLNSGAVRNLKVKVLGGGVCNAPVISQSHTCVTTGGNVNCKGFSFAVNNGTAMFGCTDDSAAIKLVSLTTNNPLITWNTGLPGNNTTVRFKVNQDTVIKVYVQDLNQPSCPTQSATVTIKAVAKPHVNVSSTAINDTLCKGQGITIRAVPTGYDKYQFLNGTSLLQDSTLPVLYLSNPPSSNVIKVVAFKQGCADTSVAKVIHVQNLPAMGLTCSVVKDTFCAGTSVNYLASPVGMTSYAFYQDFKLVQRSVSRFYNSTAVTNGSLITVFGSIGQCLDSAYSVTTGIKKYVEQPLAVPQVNCGSSSSDSLEFTWDAIAGATGYQISVDGGPFTSPSSGNNGTVHFITNLTTGDVKTLQVKALGNSVCGASTVSLGHACTTSSTAIRCNAFKYTLDQSIQQTACSGDSTLFSVSNISITNPLITWNNLVSGTDTRYKVKITQDTSIAVTIKDLNQPSCPSKTNYFTIAKVTKPVVTLTSTAAQDTLCNGTPITFNAVPGAYDRYVFYNGTSLVQDSAAPLLKINVLNANNAIKVVAYHKGCMDSSTTKYINIAPLPSVALTRLSSRDSACFADTLQFNAVPAIYSHYTFMNGNIVLQHSSSPVLKYPNLALGNNNAITVIAANNRCASVPSKAIQTEILPLPTVSLASSAVSNIVCQGSNVLFTASPNTLTQYSFYNKTTLLQAGASNKYLTKNLKNGDTVTVIGQSVYGCNSNAAYITGNSIRVDSLPDPHIIALDSGVCAGSSTQLTALVSAPFNGATFTWSTGGAGSTVTVSPNAPTTYSVTALYKGCPKTDTLGIKVDVLPKPVSKITGPGNYEKICIGDSVLMQASGGMHYLWYPAIGLKSDTGKQVYAKPQVSTAYKVKVSNIYCVSTSATDSVYVFIDLCLKDLPSKIPTLFTPNEDGINDYWVLDHVDYFTQNSLFIYNRWGEEVYSAQPYVNQWNGQSTAGGKLPDGIYYYLLDLGNGDKRKSGYVVINR